MRTAIVTGGAGFIGSHLVDRLLADGWRVDVIDSLAAGRRSNLLQHKGNRRLRLHEIDLRNGKAVKRIVRGSDTVFHLAAHANIQLSQRQHKVDLEHNLIGTINILDGMVEGGTTKLVFASTSAVYGEATVRPTPEDYAPLQTSLYGASKLACEAFAEAYTELFPLKFWAFRFANVIGERCRRGVVWDLVRKLKKNPRHLEILGDGRQSKEYLYVKDCIEGVLTGLQKSAKAVNIFNLGIKEQTSVDRVADIVIEEMRLKDVERRYTGGRRGWIGDNPVVELSMERMEQLGWKPLLSAEEAVRRTVRWTLSDLE